MNFSPISSNVSNKPSPSDVSLITELYDAIEAYPAGVEARKLLIEQLMACDWLDAARDALSGLLAIAPHDRDAQDLSNIIQAQVETKLPSEKPLTEAHNQIAAMETIKGAHSQPSNSSKTIFSSFMGKLLKHDAAGDHNVEPSGDGKVWSPIQVLSNPDSARLVTRQMVKNLIDAVDIAFQDLKEVTTWLRSTLHQSQTSTPLDTLSQASTSDNDIIREALQKRTEALTSALPVDLQHAASTAQMHIEHEVLERKYLCSESMYGDPVSDILRERFWVTEDGYPWDMEELVQAITSNGGVMRNPLSRELFTPNDVKAIIQHPLGKSLAALQVTQSELTKGVRPRTVEELVKLSAVMLKDDSADQMESRYALDEYLAYIATLPEGEQTALDKLRVPARDGHTGQQYDSSIGDAVRDARANRVCIHKIGDFLDQAAKHLRQKN